MIAGRLAMLHQGKNLAFICLFVLLTSSFAFADKLLSAEKFLDVFAKSFQKVKDYSALTVITEGKSVSRGELYYRSPDYLRIDFNDPAGQVLVIDKEMLTVYLPQYQVALEQHYKEQPGAVENLASGPGLATLQREYSVGYLLGPSPVPLDEGSAEMVVKLKLLPLTTTGFRQLILSVKGSQVRRIEGIQDNGESIVLDLQRVRVNQGIPVSRFSYTPPQDARVIADWLFTPQG
jgi:outer membrane lipoprotein-sorting protein